MKRQAHWDTRGKLGFIYQGESFYTITPVPFYIKRRKILLELLTPYIQSSNHICDLGCGDGWYINYFKNLFGFEKKIIGIDSSHGMLERARALNPDNHFYQSETGINFNLEHVKFHLVYSIATLAHIENEKIQEILESVAYNLDIDGNYIIFEQVAPFYYQGKSFIRRSIEQYEDIFQKAGFEVESVVFIKFPFHQFFERHIAKHYYSFFCRGDSDYEKRITANSHVIFRAISQFFLFFDRKLIWENNSSGWGNAFIVFKKREHNK